MPNPNIHPRVENVKIRFGKKNRKFQKFQNFKNFIFCKNRKSEKIDFDPISGHFRPRSGQTPPRMPKTTLKYWSKPSPGLRGPKTAQTTPKGSFLGWLFWGGFGPPKKPPQKGRFQPLRMMIFDYFRHFSPIFTFLPISSFRHFSQNPIWTSKIVDQNHPPTFGGCSWSTILFGPSGGPETPLQKPKSPQII